MIATLFFFASSQAPDLRQLEQCNLPKMSEDFHELRLDPTVEGESFCWVMDWHCTGLDFDLEPYLLLLGTATGGCS